MAAQLPEQKLSKSIIDNCADSRLLEVAVANRIESEHGDIQARWFNVIIAYIYTMAHNYEIGKFNNNTYEVARLSKKIKDLALSDEFTVSKYELYGDYEVQNEIINEANNLSIFDSPY